VIIVTGNIHIDKIVYMNYNAFIGTIPERGCNEVESVGIG
jgi:hypothetical protein